MAISLGTSAPGLADEAREAFVEANLLSIFYHEMGHAMVDLLGLPVLGQEEDAADVASILLIDRIFDAASAEVIAYDAAFGFLGEAVLREAEGLDMAWWDTHGPDEQRFYNTVCLFYGADPDQRDGFAEDLDLPRDRAEICPEEFDLAIASWEPIFQELESSDGAPMQFFAETDGLTTTLIGAEVAALNGNFRWPEALDVIVAPCDEANAFYDPGGPEIIVCTEFEDHLRALYDLLES